MGYKKDVILQLRDEKNQEELANNLAKKLEKMTPEQRKSYVKTVTDKLEILKAEIQDIDLKLLGIPDICHQISEDSVIRIVATSFIIATVVVAGLSFCELAPIAMAYEGFDRFMIGAGLGLTSLLGGCSGLLIGFGLSGLCSVKPLTNLINKIRKKINSVKLVKINKNKNSLEKEMEMLNKIIEKDEAYKTCGAEVTL